MNHTPLRVALRADASSQVGLGHVRRCLSLAQGLRDIGSPTCLVSRSLGADTATLSAHAGVPHFRLDAAEGQDAETTVALLRDWHPDWIVVDHYGLDAGWHARIKEKLSVRIAAIDDLGDRPLAVDLLIDHNHAHNHQARYVGHLPLGTPMLAGPRYALLSPNYATTPGYPFRETVESIGVFMGGVDAAGISERVIRACRQVARFAGRIEVATTRANPHIATLRDLCRRDIDATLLVDAADLTEFFARHDLQIGAGGGASWERCCVGAPTLALIVAKNQEAVVPGLAELGVIATPDPLGALDESAIGQAVAALLSDPQRRRSMSESSRELVDGSGARRVALHLNRTTLNVRPARQADALMMHTWRNDPATRRVSTNDSPIDWDSHVAWLARTVADPMRTLLVGMVGTAPVGVIRFDRTAADDVEVSLFLDPAMHGLGLGSALLCAGEAYFLACTRAPFGEFTARILEGNIASERVFAGAGYHPLAQGCWHKPAVPTTTRRS